MPADGSDHSRWREISGSSKKAFVASRPMARRLRCSVIFSRAARRASARRRGRRDARVVLELGDARHQRSVAARQQLMRSGSSTSRQRRADALLVKSHAGGSDGALPCSRPRYISSWKRCAGAVADGDDVVPLVGRQQRAGCAGSWSPRAHAPGLDESRSRSGAKRGFSMPSGVHGVIRADQAHLGERPAQARRHHMVAGLEQRRHREEDALGGRAHVERRRRLVESISSRKYDEPGWSG